MPLFATNITFAKNLPYYNPRTYLERNDVCRVKTYTDKLRCFGARLPFSVR